MQAVRARLALLAGLLLVLGLALAGYVARKGSADAARGPIVIGLLQALSGPAAASEAPLVAATRLAVEEINVGGGLLGRPVELRIEDTRGDPRVAAAAAERLIGEEGAVALFGCGSSSCRAAVTPVVETHRHLFFFPGAHEGIEQSAHVVYTGPTPNQQLLPAIGWAMHGFGRRLYVLGSEGVHTRRLGAVLRDFILLGGGQVLGERHLAPDAGDVGAVLAELQTVRPDVVLSTLSGESNRTLFDGLVAAGLSDLPLLSFGAAEPELRAFGGGRLERHFTAASYLQSLPGTANEAFLAGLRRNSGGDGEASDAAVSAYVGLQLWAAAVREVGSTLTDAVNDSVLHQSVLAPHGSSAVDSPSRHLWQQLRIAQVRPDGRLVQVLMMPHRIRPEPWPSFRSKEHWAALMSRNEAGR